MKLIRTGCRYRSTTLTGVISFIVLLLAPLHVDGWPWECIENACQMMRGGQIEVHYLYAKM